MQINKIQSQNFGATIEQTQALKDLLKMSTKHSSHSSVAKDFNKLHKILPLSTDKVVITNFEKTAKDKNSIFVVNTYKVNGTVVSNGIEEKFTHNINETGRSHYDAAERGELLYTIYEAVQKLHAKKPYNEADIALDEIINNKKINI